MLVFHLGGEGGAGIHPLKNLVIIMQTNFWAMWLQRYNILQSSVGGARRRIFEGPAQQITEPQAKQDAGWIVFVIIVLLFWQYRCWGGVRTLPLHIQSSSTISCCQPATWEWFKVPFVATCKYAHCFVGKPSYAIFKWCQLDTKNYS